MPLSSNEKAFMEHYEKGYELRTEYHNYKDALNEFSNAEKIIKEDSSLYREKAYCYQRLGDYSRAVDTAKEGL